MAVPGAAFELAIQRREALLRDLVLARACGVALGSRSELVGDELLGAVAHAVRDVAAVETELTTGGSPLREAFVAGLGIDVDPAVEGVFELVRREGPIPANEPELSGLVEPTVDAATYGVAVEYLLNLSVVTRQGGDLVADPVVARVLGA